MDRIFAEYENAIRNIKNKYKNEIILVNIYYSTKLRGKRLKNVIKIWNQKQKIFARKNNIKLIEIDKILYKEEHFNNEIEPSEIGSKLLADAIL